MVKMILENKRGEVVKAIFDPLFHSPCKKKPLIGKEEMEDWRENVKKP